MSDFVTVAKFSTLADLGRELVEVDDRLIVLFRVGNDVLALDDVCTHDGGPLGEGLLEDHTNWSLFNGINATLSLEIFSNARSLFTVAQDRAWAAAFTLILIVFVFTILARLVTAFFGRRIAV